MPRRDGRLHPFLLVHFLAQVRPMALTSPYFKNVPQLTAAAANSPWLSKGSRGLGVHLIQFALIDLGFPMPKSIGGLGFDPDGIFGSETKEQVIAFQNSHHGGPPVTDDGAVGAITMAKLDRAMGSPTHKVRSHIFVVTEPTKFAIADSIRLAKELYGHYGIDFQVGSIQSLGISAEEEQALGNNDLKFTDAQAFVNEHATVQPLAHECMVFFIFDFIAPGSLALSFADHRGAITRITTRADVSTLAHEIVHQLLEAPSFTSEDNHVPHERNIMNTMPRTPPFVLSHDQVIRMRDGRRCQLI